MDVDFGFQAWATWLWQRQKLDRLTYVYIDECVWIFKTMYTQNFRGGVIYYILCSENRNIMVQKMQPLGQLLWHLPPKSGPEK